LYCGRGRLLLATTFEWFSEENMLKSVVVATTALAIAGSSIVYAQQGFRGPGADRDGGPRFAHRHRLSAADMAAFADARIAALKAGLQLTPDQAKNWPAFEQALREMAQLRMQLRQAREAASQQGDAPSAPTTPTTPFDRLAKRADNMAKVSAALKHIADTGAPLFTSLDDAQKHRFHMLARMLRPHHHRMFARNDGRGWGWRQGNGDRQDGNGYWRGPQGRRFGQDDRAPGARLQNLMQSDDDQGSEL
jgi:zinc resistance-associated protein